MTQKKPWINDSGSVMTFEPTDEPFRFRVFKDGKPFKMKAEPNDKMKY